MTLFNYVDNLLNRIFDAYSNYNIADNIDKKLDEAVEKIDSKLDKMYEEDKSE